MDQRGLCVWNGEWDPIYARREYGREETDDTDGRRYNVLKDQLPDIYAPVRRNPPFARRQEVFVSKGWSASLETHRT
ncbi:glycoside hydrolase family 5 protein [Paxillus rubicundulus Ve08.2h10]|uniref:Glycoside hydrolase family 5 protein n=1 Tax=Paxillus rubicundulus Ve08.2h10 TaxID=930991 RepID=A0A0D0DXJ5_9AGAM|nr:glycoside hydrolase family 5 protein [Paxillus rubicundulus Ve08.2h10]